MGAAGVYTRLNCGSFPLGWTTRYCVATFVMFGGDAPSKTKLKISGRTLHVLDQSPAAMFLSLTRFDGKTTDRVSTVEYCIKQREVQPTITILSVLHSGTGG